MIRTVIIDDEAHNRDTLRKMLERYCPQVAVVAEAASNAEGIREIREQGPDLVFLDIMMKGGSGFDLIEFLSPVGFSVIFISAYDKDTIHNYKLSSLEFLTKPINPNDLISVVKHAEKKNFTEQCGHFLQRRFPDCTERI